MLDNKKPKFKLVFSINDISNIPHTSGYCFIELAILDGNSTGLMASISSFKPFSSSTKTSSETKSISDSGSSPKRSPKHSTFQAHASSRSIHVRTPQYKIHGFKCHFNFALTCNLKFAIKRRDNLIGDKYLTLRVLYKPEKDSKNDSAVDLGVIKINLAEYLNFDEPITAKYLLQESKINSILNLTVGLEELPTDFDFHTQLRIDESKQNHASKYSSLNMSAGKNKNTSYNVPQFQKKTIFGGIDGVINPQSDPANGNSNLSDNSGVVDEGAKDERNERIPQTERQTTTLGSKPFDDVIVDPIIGNLYRKVLESTWDPDLHPLLKFTPQNVVDNIFEPAEGSDKASKNVQYYQNLSKDTEDENVTNSNGLIVESKFREDLKSWSVSWT